jgi:hypothetical protein
MVTILRVRDESLDFIPRSAHTKKAMTNEELLDDLKQFIEATVSQQMAGFATKDDLANFATKDDINGLKSDIKALDEKLDTVQDAIAETLTHALEPIDASLHDHEQRLGRLEHRSA